MATGGDAPCPRVGLLFTRFPVTTETFLQREVKALRQLQPGIQILALWPPPSGSAASQQPDNTFRPSQLLGLLWWIPYWTFHRPAAMTALAKALLGMRVPNLTNLIESLLGIGYALVRARALSDRVDHLHAVWASAPATAAWVIRQLTGIPFSMAGHAYDLYENGGDGLLETKIADASFMRSSTGAGCRRWIALGAPAEKVCLIRRGLPDIPEFEPDKRPAPVVRLLAVGRLVEKMGYPFLLDLLAKLKRAGLPFRATIVGGGPLQGELEKRRDRLGLAGRVDFTGYLPFDKIQALYRTADVFLFTGQVAASGDRAGFPNAIAEAMAFGLPVCATAVGAVGEGIRDGETGILLGSVDEAAARVRQLLKDRARYESVRTAAYQWVASEFDIGRNMENFLSLLKERAGQRS